jgi:conjugative transfer pilus assembly protein TraH
MKNCILTSLFGIVLLIAPVSYADLGDELDKMFDAVGAMSAVSDPRKAEGEERNYYSMGSYNLKFPRTNSTVVNFTRPDLSAGCGGISLYGGSFSFINTDEFVQQLRTIAANASGYLFQLALTSMCPSCAVLMDKIQEKISEMNQLLRGECNDIKAFASSHGVTEEGAMDVFGKNRLETEASDAVNSGVFDDWFGKENDKSTNPSIGEAGDALGVDFSINVTWEALQLAGVESWEWVLPSGDDALGLNMMEMLMNVVDINIYRKIDPVPAAGDEKYAWEVQEPSTLKFSELLYGLDSAKSVWLCPTDALEKVKCLTVTETPMTTANFTGILTTTKDILIGSGGELGLLGKLHEKNPTLDDDEVQLLALIPGNVKDALISMHSNKGAAAVYGEYIAHNVAIKMAELLINDFLNKINDAGKSLNPESRQVLINSIKSARARYIVDMQLAYDDMNKLKDNTIFFVNIKNTLQSL